MEVQPDFRDLLESFGRHDVEYVIVGGYALAFHGAPRFTGDIDLYVRPTADNARRVVDALADFGFGSLDITPEDLQTPGRVIQLGVQPVRIDLVTRISGVSWEEADAGKVAERYGDVAVHYLGRAQYVANKRALGRLKDLADLEALGESSQEDRERTDADDSSPDQGDG
jgi:hypothetical protein